jgi:hypothetical protein
MAVTLPGLVGRGNAPAFRYHAGQDAGALPRPTGFPAHPHHAGTPRCARALLFVRGPRGLQRPGDLWRWRVDPPLAPPEGPPSLGDRAGRPRGSRLRPHATAWPAALRGYQFSVRTFTCRVACPGRLCLGMLSDVRRAYLTPGDSPGAKYFAWACHPAIRSQSLNTYLRGREQGGPVAGHQPRRAPRPEARGRKIFAFPAILCLTRFRA